MKNTITQLLTQKQRMRKALILLFALLLVLPLYSYPKVRGTLFIIGGGRRPESMMKKFIELSSKFRTGKVIIFPMASSTPQEVGPELVKQFIELGSHDVVYHVLDREQALQKENLEILDDIGGVYFSGGVQSRLTDILVDTPFHRKLLEIYEEGAVIGGTSAGAAVMSEIMITGDENREVEKGREFATIQAKNIVTSPGLGFLKTAIIDQHFVTRKRHNRLISLVAENPELLGIGIDESTAIIIEENETFKVIGEKNVIVYDASQAKIDISSSQPISGIHIIMHILKAGDEFNLNAKEVQR